MLKQFGLSAAVAAALALATPASAWEPEKSVEIIVAAGAGGASDQMARMLQAAIQKHELIKQPVIVSLKGGASGAEGLMDMKASAGDPHKFIIAYSLIYTLPLAAKIPFNWRELSPVAIVAMDEFVLWTNAGAPYKTVKEFIAAAKDPRAPFKVGGTGSKREDHIITAFVEKKTGAKFSYLPYKSGGEAGTQLVGNHTAANTNNPSENLEVWRAGQVRALCVFAKRAHVLHDEGDRPISPGTIFRPARKKASTSPIPCCAASSCRPAPRRSRPRSTWISSRRSARRPSSRNTWRSRR